MYSYDIGIFTAQDIIDSQAYDPWLVRRLEQISSGTPASQLITRWEFDTEKMSTLTYVGYLAVRVTSYFIFIIPQIHLFLGSIHAHILLRFYNSVGDRFQYVYALATRTVPLYESKKNATQLFLTLMVADQRVKDHLWIESQILAPGQLWTKESKYLYNTYFKKAIVTPQFNRDLVNRAVQKTLDTLTPEEFKILFTTFSFKVGPFPEFRKQFVLKALSCCEGEIKLPEGMRFDGDEIAVFGQTRCSVELNGARFANIPLQAKNKIFEFNFKSELKANFIT